MSYRKNLNSIIYGGDNMVNLSDVRYLPRWIILMIDIVLIFGATYFSCYIIEKLNNNTRVFYNNEYM